MYRIIGNDGKTYGPVRAEQIREWLAQSRVDNRTPVLADGATEWTYLGRLPEFAKETSAPPPVAAPVPPVFQPAPKTNAFATAGFVCGLLSWICCCGCPFNVFGLIFSLIALAQIGAAPEARAGRGLAIAGVILSAVSLFLGLGLGLFQLALHPANVLWHVGQF